MQTPPPLPSARQPDWWSRNWKWLVPVACFAGLISIAGFAYLILNSIKSSDAYQGAVLRIKNSPAVISELGSPVNEGFLFTGHISVNGASGKSELAIPVSGPKGRATAYVLATKNMGEWHFDHLIVQMADTRKRIDISDPVIAPVEAP